tara:strand:- start:156 stop:416 length:261 start_codon:yes stop_codon:yes gene_type:complete
MTAVMTEGQRVEAAASILARSRVHGRVAVYFAPYVKSALHLAQCGRGNLGVGPVIGYGVGPMSADAFLDWLDAADYKGVQYVPRKG